MTTTTSPAESLSDQALLAETVRAAADERHATARLVALLSEVDARRLYLGQGCSSLFTYCTQVLHLSEHAAYGRIEAARAGRRFPLVLERLVSGELTLTAAGLLRPHLTTENHQELLDAARHQSKRHIEELVARLAPRPPVPNTVRRLPAPTTCPPTNAPRAAPTVPSEEPLPRVDSALVASPGRAARPAVQPLAPERYKVQLTISAETRAKLRQLQDLLRHQVPDGDLAVIFDRALTVLLVQVQRSKLAAAARPRDESRRLQPGSRHVPAAVKREVWARDGGRCAFVGDEGRCTETGFLEFHHVEPFARGGPTMAGNLELRCRSHNGYEATQCFGPRDLPFVRERPVACEWQLGPDRVGVRVAGLRRPWTSSLTGCLGASRAVVSLARLRSGAPFGRPGSQMIVVTPELLAIDLRTCGEDELAFRAATLDGRDMDLIGRRAFELLPTLRTRLLAAALVRAAIEILEGAPREPRRKHRRLAGIYPGTSTTTLRRKLAKKRAVGDLGGEAGSSGR